MQIHLTHDQVNVRPENLPFDRDLTTFLDWKTLLANEGMRGVADRSDDSLWFIGQVKAVSNDDGPGRNHLATGAEARADVDVLAAYL